MKTPRVSIGLPVYNGENFLRAAVQTILAQDYSDWELIIADNASTDSTEAICRELAASDSRIRYYRNETNIGAARNYNKVFELARGEYFKWAAHDDECHPSMIRRCVEVLDAAPKSVTMVYPLAELIDENGRTLAKPLDQIESRDRKPHRRLGQVLWSLNMCDPVFGLIRSEHLRETQVIGPFFGADYVLLGELAMRGEIREIDEVLFRLRAHPQRSMKANRSRKARAAWYNPSGGRKLFVLPDWERMVWEMLKSANHAPVSWLEKRRCQIAVLVVHYWRRFRNAAGLLKWKLKQRLELNPSSGPVSS